MVSLNFHWPVRVILFMFFLVDGAGEDGGAQYGFLRFWRLGKVCAGRDNSGR